jgi:REP element-mobilizing transposase RayT
MIRGIERRKIFRDAKDREDFLERLGNLLLETKTGCYAWALLPNHAHFLVRTGEVPVATVMRRLLTGYVVSFNRRHRRHGHLFQSRYKSLICQEDTYLKELVRYLHLNPLRARIVPDLATLNSYPYSGHSAVMGKKKRAWQDVDYVLSSFGATIRSGRREYRAYVEAGVEQGRREDLSGGGLIRSFGGWSVVKRLRSKRRDHLKSDERILGDSKFVHSILAQADEKITSQSELRRRGYDLDRIAERVSEICYIDREEIFARSRRERRVQAKSLFCFWAVRELGVSLTDVARRLGMSPAGVGYAVQRGEVMARERGYQLTP